VGKIAQLFPLIITVQGNFAHPTDAPAESGTAS
jgi:hypothetical protein